MNKTRKDYLNDLYKLGVVQGEHNINWNDEYNLVEHSKNYYHKIKAIADEYGISLDENIEDDYNKWDESGFRLHELIKEHIIKKFFIENHLVIN